MAKKDLLKRTVSGILFLVVLIAATVFIPVLFPYVVLVALYMMLKEFYTISTGDALMPQKALAIGSAALFFALHYLVRLYGLDSRLLAVPALPAVGLMASMLFVKDRSKLDSLPWIFEGLLYVGLPVFLLPLLCIHDGAYNWHFLISLLVIMCLSDTGAYVFGTAFGQKSNSRKLAPSISPKKSWWGFWSGLVCATGAGIALHYIGWLEFPLVHCAVLSALLSAAGVCGDLFESLFKRHFSVKDSGNSIPGHGGFLDRFDSSLFAIPVAAAYISIFNLL